MLRAQRFAFACAVTALVVGVASPRDVQASTSPTTQTVIIPRPDRGAPMREVVYAGGVFEDGSLDESMIVPLPSAGKTAPQDPSSWRRLLQTNLLASGIEDAGMRAHYERAYEERLAPLFAKLKKVHNEISRARKLHAGLHKILLRRYNPTSDGLDAVLDRGEYNCVSATLLYGMSARAVGLRPAVVESPRHIFVRVDFDDYAVDVETTSPRGFELRRDLELFRRFILGYKYATPEDIAKYGLRTIFEEFHGHSKPVSLEQATAFLWHNTGERALERGEALDAARAFEEEYRFYPELAIRGERIGFYLARAFRIEYEEGRFDTAFRIAEIETRMFPGRTTARDRYLASTAKRIQDACEDGDSRKAEDVLTAVAGVLSEPTDIRRLERETCPRIAAAAVRSGEWDRAQRMAERFAVAEPDAVEAGRFMSWLESRRFEAPNYALEEACSDPRRPGSLLGTGIYGTTARPSSDLGSYIRAKSGQGFDGTQAPVGDEGRPKGDRWPERQQ